jgi:hypothetical protein
VDAYARGGRAKQQLAAIHIVATPGGYAVDVQAPAPFLIVYNPRLVSAVGGIFASQVGAQLWLGHRA